MALQAKTFKQIIEVTSSNDVDIILASETDKWYDHDFQFSDYQLVISSGLGIENVPNEHMNRLENFVEQGGGLVIVHQGVASFTDWPKFQEIIGKGWYGSHTGPHTFWDDKNDAWGETPIFHGVGPAHGKQHEFVIDMRNKEHSYYERNSVELDAWYG